MLFDHNNHHISAYAFRVLAADGDEHTVEDSYDQAICAQGQRVSALHQIYSCIAVRMCLVNALAMLITNILC